MSETIQESLEQLIAEGLVEKRGDYYRLTAKGLALSEIQHTPDVLPEVGSDYGNA